ncbi:MULTISPECIES: DUF4097 family beta strand repeat-containing protein [Fructobacillus]|jgi:DUF4097 and DUF4098 domain-containing protein YvlB|uniref:Fusaric acid resistance protein-like (YvlB) n=1 Tax=Fructobacillus cardui TaxID=2893170 RepID=A0ABM9MW49_9LACO|nr:DUF4097 family beta strand repeat-containing protein [Fructobacillus sp. EFB-N1]KMK52728.1 hypothetical protein FEFB_15620 [Fructobacillus sp. EFB-N1]CAK1242038.1 Fusaric acid resistance protein-like (YvlB) [Fructobacillus cardui]CAK1244528.1 Fusaric acid resistance protein-like (YvlB) [Fructobacillus cardui]CAK1245026.1 Fusaric acid resistance protein-like (YvlB) [Fructobacillus cardui]
MKKSLKLGVFLMGVGVVLSSVSFVLAKPGEIDFARVLTRDLSHVKTETHDISPEKSQLTNENVQGLKVDTNNFDIVVKSGDKYAVEETDSSEHAVFETKVENQQLVVVKKSRKANNFQAGDQRLEITVPKNIKLQTLDIQTKNGDIKLKNISTNQVQLTNTNGDIELKQVTIDGGGNVTNENGDIEVEQSQLPIVEAETKSGSLSMKRAYHVGYGDGANLHLMNQSGDVNLD